ncbi:MAG TPA: OmpA family protein [Polyangiales bacterium]|jgi:outer membrane protein OmpA-like peptidoglycan-associated protein|nr:OmpA family protein [Polyangiales bacterium]
MNHHIQRSSWSCAAAASTLLISLAGCAHDAPPRELVDARAAYTRAENGTARTLDPTALHEAKVALERAERQYSNDDDEKVIRDSAYIAARKAQLAEVQANGMAWRQREVDANAKLEATQANKAQATRGQLQQAQQQLESERTAKVAAEQKAREALAKLAAANAAQVKEEPRGTVITLAGGVLFASGKAELLPGAQQRLASVADALKDDEGKHILIEGHTDSRGSEATNLALSQQRANSVRDYFVSRGIPTERITANGLGSNRPVADNSSAEGRADNRRVEIVIQPIEPK